jgi:hypothetical protein
MSNLCEVTTFANDSAIGAIGRDLFQKTEAIRVLSIGPVEHGSLVHDALLNGPDFHLSIATDYRELWKIPAEESVHVAILHNTFSEFETEAACRLIRRRWIDARILIVSNEESNLEDALYDDRVVARVSSEILSATIERLAGIMRV